MFLNSFRFSKRARYASRVVGLILIVLVIITGSLGCAPKREYNHGGQGVYHIVQRGQTLYRIGLTYGVSVDVLARANNISDPNVISVGDAIFVPGAEQALHVEPYYAYSGTSPFMPVAGTITSNFGAPRNGYRHTGIDIAAPRGTPIRAVLDGRVVFSGRQSRYGLIVIIDHADGYSSVYAHNDKNLVSAGDKVRRGDTIALVGKSGNASGYHLHFELHRHDKIINPTEFLRSSR